MRNIKEENYFLNSYNADNYERLSVTVDVMLMKMNKDLSSVQVLLTKREEHPFKDCWALPGSFIHVDESAYSAACRALKEKTGVTNVYMEQLYAMSQPNRDPRTRVLSIAYIGLLPYDCDIKLSGNAVWFDVKLTDDQLIVESENPQLPNRIVYELGQKSFNNGVIKVNNKYIEKLTEDSSDELAFDHQEIILEGMIKLRKNVLYEDYAFNLVAKEFTLVDLARVYEIILNQKMYKNALKRDKVGNKIEPTGNVIRPITSQRSSTAYKYKRGE